MILPRRFFAVLRERSGRGGTAREVKRGKTSSKSAVKSKMPFQDEINLTGIIMDGEHAKTMEFVLSTFQKRDKPIGNMSLRSTKLTDRNFAAIVEPLADREAPDHKVLTR